MAKIKTFKDFADTVLIDIGAPVTPLNEQKMAEWAIHEEPASQWSDWNNPLNTTLPMPGYYADSGTYRYPSIDEGAVATADTLLNTPGVGYDRIVANLRANGSIPDFSAAVVGSSWAASHYGGSPDALENAGPVGIPLNTPTTGHSVPTKYGKYLQPPVKSTNGITATPTSFHIPNPVNLLTNPLGTVFGAIEPFLAMMALATLGLGLIGVGIFKMTSGGKPVSSLVPSGTDVAKAAAA